MLHRPPGDVGQMLMQGSASSDVQQLPASAYAKDRQTSLVGATAALQLAKIHRAVRGPAVRMPLRSLKRRIEIGPPGEKESGGVGGERFDVHARQRRDGDGH